MSQYEDFLRKQDEGRNMNDAQLLHKTALEANFPNAREAYQSVLACLKELSLQGEFSATGKTYGSYDIEWLARYRPTAFEQLVKMLRDNGFAVCWSSSGLTVSWGPNPPAQPAEEQT